MSEDFWFAPPPHPPPPPSSSSSSPSSAHSLDGVCVCVCAPSPYRNHSSRFSAEPASAPSPAPLSWAGISVWSRAPLGLFTQPLADHWGPSLWSFSLSVCTPDRSVFFWSRGVNNCGLLTVLLRLFVICYKGGSEDEWGGGGHYSHCSTWQVSAFCLSRAFFRSLYLLTFNESK